MSWRDNGSGTAEDRGEVEPILSDGFFAIDSGRIKWSNSFVRDVVNRLAAWQGSDESSRPVPKGKSLVSALVEKSTLSDVLFTASSYLFPIGRCRWPANDNQTQRIVFL